MRVITYFTEDVDRVAEIIQGECDVDWENSVDKGEQLDPDQFGYRSQHYVVSLTPERLDLTECAKFYPCVAEVQVRSVLQHAWAEIEHDLGYKSSYAVPAAIRRRFARLAGLLEIADTEFDQIRESIQEYQESMPGQMEESPETTALDLESLRYLLENSPFLRETDEDLADGLPVVHNDGAVQRLLEALALGGFTFVAEVIECLDCYRETLLRFRAKVPIHGESVFAGLCLWYLCYVRVLEAQGRDGLMSYWDALVGAADNEVAIKARNDVADGLVAALEESGLAEPSAIEEDT